MFLGTRYEGLGSRQLQTSADKNVGHCVSYCSETYISLAANLMNETVLDGTTAI